MQLRLLAELVMIRLTTDVEYITKALMITFRCSKKEVKRLANGGWLKQCGDHSCRYYTVIKGIE